MKIDSPEFHQIMGGHIPWSVEGVREVAERAAELHHLPHDDWDRSRGREAYLRDHPDESSGGLFANIDRMENQIAFYIMDMYQNEAEIVRASHVNRWFMIVRFLGEHQERLRREDLWHDSEDESEASLIAEGLWEVLAVEPYPVRILEEEGRIHHYGYDLEDVIEKARRRQRELEQQQDEEGPGTES